MNQFFLSASQFAFVAGLIVTLLGAYGMFRFTERRPMPQQQARQEIPPWELQQQYEARPQPDAETEAFEAMNEHLKRQFDAYERLAMEVIQDHREESLEPDLNEQIQTLTERLASLEKSAVRPRPTVASPLEPGLSPIAEGPIAPTEPSSVHAEPAPRRSTPPPVKLPRPTTVKLPAAVLPIGAATEPLSAKRGNPAPPPTPMVKPRPESPRPQGFHLPSLGTVTAPASEVPRLAATRSAPETPKPQRTPEAEKTPAILTDSERRQILTQLRLYPNRQICIKAATGDPAANQFAEELKSAFVEAGWDVEGILETESTARDPQLILSTGTFPVPKEVAVAFRVLASVGLDPASKFDPNQFKNRAVLIVNAPAAGRNTPAQRPD